MLVISVFIKDNRVTHSLSALIKEATGLLYGRYGHLILFFPSAITCP